MDYYKIFGWLFFVQIFDEYGNLLNVSDMMPYHCEAVVRDCMAERIMDYDRAYRAIAFCVDIKDSSVSMCGSLIYDAV